MGEELEETGEIEEVPETEEPAEETGEIEGETSETEVEEEEEEENAPVPLKRFNKVYGEFKTTTEKFDLFKRLGPDKYYDVYPDEKPEAEPLPEVPVSISEAASMVITGGQYDGQTLGEVAEIDPLAAMGMYDDYRTEQRQTIDNDAKLKAETDQEEKDFKAEQAKGLFGKEYSALTVIEQGKIDSVISATLGWMEDTRRGGGNLFDARYLMNRDADMSAARGGAAATAVDAIARGAVQSISGTKGSEQTGYGAYVNLTNDQMSDKLDTMSESEKIAFYEKAPANVKAKFPNMPW